MSIRSNYEQSKEMMVTENCDIINEENSKTTEVVVHQHGELPSESGPDLRDKGIYVKGENAGGGRSIQPVPRNGYSNRVVKPLTTSRFPGAPNHLPPSRSHHPSQSNQQRRNHRRGLSADRG